MSYKPMEANILQTFYHRFKEASPNKDRIEGKEAIKILQVITKGIPDVEEIINIYSREERLRDENRTLLLPELQSIYLRLNEDVKKITGRFPMACIHGEDYMMVRGSKLLSERLPNSEECGVQIHRQKMFSIVPWEIGFIKKVSSRIMFENVVQICLFERRPIEPYYCFNYSIHAEPYILPDLSPMPEVVQLLLHVIHFSWVKAHELLRHRISQQEEFRQSFCLVAILDDLRYIQEEIEAKPKVMEPHFSKKRRIEAPSTQELDAPLRNKIMELRKKLNFTYHFCRNMYTKISQPYIRAIIQFLSIGPSDCQEVLWEICHEPNISVFIRFLMASRFMNELNYSRFVEELSREMELNPKIEHILFLKHDVSSLPSIRRVLTRFFDEEPGCFERNALVCLNVIFKLLDSNEQEVQPAKMSISSSALPALESIVKHYERYLKMHRDPTLFREYMIQMLSIPKSVKQATKLNIRPQCVYYFEEKVFVPRTFSIQMEKLIRGSVHNFQNKKNRAHAKVEVMETSVENKVGLVQSHCCICYQSIETFNPISFLNTEIKGTERTYPYLGLTEEFEQALVWCPLCNHGGHFGHLEKWFDDVKLCPVKNCKCQCKF